MRPDYANAAFFRPIKRKDDGLENEVVESSRQPKAINNKAAGSA